MEQVRSYPLERWAFAPPVFLRKSFLGIKFFQVILGKLQKHLLPQIGSSD